jgi:hypothetical protein
MEVGLPRDTHKSTVSRPWASLDYSGFRLIFVLSLFATTAQQMRQTQNLYQVYELSGSALQLGLTGLAQGIPIFALGLFAGALIFGGAISATLTLGCWKTMPGLRNFGTAIRRR